MAANPDIQRKVDAAEELGYDCTPHPQDSMICACGYEGQPAYVVPYSEMDESETDSDMFVCPECGDA